MKLSRRQWFTKAGLLIPAVGIIRPTLAQALIINSYRFASGGGGSPVAFDNKFENGSASGTSPFSFVSNAGNVTGTVGSNSNRFLVAFIGYNTDVTTVTGMTWNSVSMTQIGTTFGIGAGDYELSLFGLVAPATGNQTLSATWTGGAAGVWLGAISLYNVNQGGVGAGSTQNNGTDTGTGTSASSTITSADGNMAIVGHVNNNATSTTISAGTEAWEDERFSGNAAMAYRASTIGSTVITYTLGASVLWGHIKVDIIKA